MTHDDELDDLDQRMRAGLAALVAEAPDPPALPAAAPSASAGPRLRLLAAAAVVAVGALAAGAIVLAGSDGRAHVTTDPTTATPPPDRPLAGTDWLLQEATVDGEPITIEPERVPFLYVTPEGTVSLYDGCNHGGGEVDVGPEPGSLRFEAGPVTAMGCGAARGELAHVSVAIGTGLRGPTTYAIDGDELTIEADGVVLRWQASDELFTPTDDEVLVQDELHGVPFRVTWTADEDGYGMELQRRAGESQPQGGTGVGVALDDPASNLMKVDARGDALLFGLVPSTAASATYAPEGGEPQPIELRALDGRDPGFWGVLEVVDGSQRWEVVAYDAQGVEVDRLRWGPRG